MDGVLRHLWIAFVVAAVVNGRSWWDRARSRIQAQPDLEPGYRQLYRGYLFVNTLPWLAMGLGVVSGQVPSVFDYLHPSEGNAFVLAWWDLMAALLCLGTYWIFFAGGAEALERHPGVSMVPEWPASKLRIYWLGVVAWNVGIGTLLFLDVFGGPGKRRDSASAGVEFWPFFPVFFVGMWLLVTFLLSAMGGWHALAAHYAAKSAFSGRRFRFRSAQLRGRVNYGGCLTLGAGPDGLYLAVLPLFRVWHPPLVIPWDEITAREARSWLFPAIELEFARAPGTSVRLSRGLAQSLFDASGTHVIVQPR